MIRVIDLEIAATYDHNPMELLAILRTTGGVVRVRGAWQARSTEEPANGQMVRDLINAGWLTEGGEIIA